VLTNPVRTRRILLLTNPVSTILIRLLMKRGLSPASDVRMPIPPSPALALLHCSVLDSVDSAGL